MIAARLTLIYVSLIIIFLMFTSVGNAKIPSDAIVGICSLRSVVYFVNYVF